MLLPWDQGMLLVLLVYWGILLASKEVKSLSIYYHIISWSVTMWQQLHHILFQDKAFRQEQQKTVLRFKARASTTRSFRLSYQSLSQPSPVQFRLGRQGTQLEHPTPPTPHKLSKAKEGLYWITHPCPWLNNSAEIVHSLSFKERKMSQNSNDYIVNLCNALPFEILLSFTICDKVSAIYV